MDVNAAEIIANIKSQALVGNTGAVDDLDRILRYLNKGYSLVYARCAKACPSLYRKTQEVTVTDGAGDFAEPVHEVLAVFDKNNGYRRLDRRSTADVELEDAGLSATGTPCSYDVRFGGLETYPLNSTVLKVPYIPPPAALTADTLEADILIPVVHHEVLEWAALYTLAYDERDKLVGSELQFTKGTFDGLMDSLILFLLGQRPAAETRVKGH
ncbi:hypothetical protein [Mesorhizobium sp. B2-3-10]|uniref:phage adaptor protein n=1 Tax=Mesorhizobium sp. B2-3-10 TaxID=2589954 RepID=UPI001129FEE0|nr:hypothetical protein [Mesorhizobium sp. B2-3-10]TPL98320.1 hypothetical protein FJ943_15560 [Mesorhizobium sp. B2-3-10]